MSSGNFEPIVLRSVKLPYIVFAVLFVPMLALGAFVVLTKGQPVGLFIPAAMFAYIYAFLASLKLTLTDDRIVFRVWWWSKEMPISSIRSIEHPKYGLQRTLKWDIRSVDGKSFVARIATFDGHALRAFLQALAQKNPNAKISVISFASKHAHPR
jgi:hypothetical protein